MKNKTILLLAAYALTCLAASCCRRTPTPAATEGDPPAPTAAAEDYGAEPTVLDIETLTLGNDNYRTTLWTGSNLQVTLMSIPAGSDVGLERHAHIDQFLRIERGTAEVMMGDRRDSFDFVRIASDDDAIFVPAGKWHNIVNRGDSPLKIYSIYAPAEHPRGTVHPTREDAIRDEANHNHDH